MSDAISAAISSCKVALDIIKGLNEIEKSLDKAELRGKLADAYHALADVRLAHADLRDQLTTQSGRIRELEKALDSQGEVVRHLDGMYTKDATGKPAGSPFCMHCWGQAHRLVPLVYPNTGGGNRRCTACKQEYYYDKVLDDPLMQRPRSSPHWGFADEVQFQTKRRTF